MSQRKHLMLRSEAVKLEGASQPPFWPEDTEGCVGSWGQLMVLRTEVQEPEQTATPPPGLQPKGSRAQPGRVASAGTEPRPSPQG